MFLGNLYIPLSILIIGLFYLETLDGFVNRKLLIGVIILYELLCVMNFVFTQTISDFPGIPGGLGSLLLMSFSILLFNRLLNETQFESLFKEPIVWINTGVLMYYSVSLIYFALFNHILQISHSFLYTTVLVNACALILFYIILTIGFWKAYKQKVYH